LEDDGHTGADLLVGSEEDLVEDLEAGPSVVVEALGAEAVEPVGNFTPKRMSSKD